MNVIVFVWQWELARAAMLGVCTSYLATFFTTVRLHRGQAHQVVAYVGWLDWALRLGLWMFVGVNRREWSVVHRKHHIYVDTDQDPHSPLQYGRVKVLFFTAVYYQRTLRCPTFSPEDFTLSCDGPVDRWDRVFNRGFRGLAFTGTLVAALFVLEAGLGWVTLLVPAAWILTHYGAYLLKGGFTNSEGHRLSEAEARSRGWNSIAGVAQNRFWTSWLTVGEAGDHLDHHLAPHSVFIGRWYGDPGGMFIWLMIKLGLASRPTCHELTRAELRMQLASGPGGDLASNDLVTAT